MQDLVTCAKVAMGLSEKDLMEWTQAVNQLVNWYEKGEGSINPCPLCKVAYNRGGSEALCDSCLWSVFEGVKCITYFSRSFDLDVVNVGSWVIRVKMERDEQFCQERLKMLVGWQKVLKFALKRRLSKNVGSIDVEKV